jgi:SAM-dependent methyltransferase
MMQELRAALGRLAPDEFDGLFGPTDGQQRRFALAPEVTAVLARAGLVEGEREVRGLRRIRRRGPHFYLMELGVRIENVQDVWPETDALLAALDAAPPGALFDVGTGTGILAIEAAARGHRVVATDIYPTVLALARANAALNGVAHAIDFRRGHLFEPVAGEAFDLILSAPHYGGTGAQLRLELLLQGDAHLRDGGRMVIASMFEWEGDGLLGVEGLLRELAARGCRVEVRPLPSSYKREWFSRAVGDPALRLVSRHRFTITVERGGAGGLAITMPEDAPEETFVPLARLRGGATAVIADGDDVARLEQILDALGAARFELAQAPRGLLDACRFGAQSCVDDFGAAKAIVDAAGRVRPCTHGDVVAGAADPLSAVDDRLEALAREAEARRGCTDCAAYDVCSRCLFPVPLDESRYCELVRRHARRLPHLARLWRTLPRLTAPAAPLAVARWPHTEWAAPEPLPDGARERLAALWNQYETWIVATPVEHRLFWLQNGRLCDAPVAAAEAALGARIADGERVDDAPAPTLARLIALFDPTSV